MNDDIYWIWLSRVEISITTKLNLLEKFKLPKNIWFAKEEYLGRTYLINS